MSFMEAMKKFDNKENKSSKTTNPFLEKLKKAEEQKKAALEKQKQEEVVAESVDEVSDEVEDINKDVENDIAEDVDATEDIEEVEEIKEVEKEDSKEDTDEVSDKEIETVEEEPEEIKEEVKPKETKKGSKRETGEELTEAEGLEPIEKDEGKPQKEDPKKEEEKPEVEEEKKPKTRKKRTTKKKADTNDEDEKSEMFSTAMSYEEAVQAITSPFCNEEFEQLKEEVALELSEIVITEDMNSILAKEVNAKLSNLYQKIWYDFQASKTLYENLSQRDVGLIDIVKNSSIGSGSNDAQRKKSGIEACMMYCAPGSEEPVNLFELLAYAREQYNYFRSVMEHLEFKKNIMISMNAALKIEDKVLGSGLDA